jgi:alpha-ketoglutarate-dependent taurine dioxygenase
MDPHIVDFERMEEWYRAYNRFASIIRDTRFQYRALLESGKIANKYANIKR